MLAEDNGAKLVIIEHVFLFFMIKFTGHQVSNNNHRWINEISDYLHSLKLHSRDQITDHKSHISTVNVF